MAVAFPELARQYMRTHDINARAFAKAMRVSPSQVSNWLSKGVPPSFESCARAAELFGMPVDEVLIAAGRSERVGRDGAYPEELRLLLDQLTGAELTVVEATARGLLRVRQETPVPAAPSP